MMEKNAKIYVAGHRGMVGSAIVRELQRQGYTNIVTRTHKELDLTRQDAVEKFFAAEKPEYVFLAAAKVGGIVANQNALADFMYDNMILEMNVIHSAWKNGCRKLEFLGSSCIYPRMAPQPMKESCLLTSELEKTNEAYALAKISGLKYPNPEIKEAMALGMEYARKCNADLLLATDPDCDRVGIAVKNKAGEYELLTGNQTGMLLLDYICSQRIKHGKMPADPVMIKTIVTMDMGEQIAAHYGLRTVNVLTGFKFIGEQIGKLEQLGKADSYVLGFEESYGYLTGSYVRDKDGVDGAYMICEMFSYYATQGISLLDRLDELYKTYGYCLNTLHSYEFDGSAGFARMQSIMQAFRGGIKEFGGKKVVRLLDYVQGLDGLPKSDVLKFLLENNCSLVVRPSGTEPKLKIYISVSAENKEMAEEVEDEIAKTAEKWIC